MTIWTREPFFGGCDYHSHVATVTGYYSPADPIEFEADCKAWNASNRPGQVFETAEAAMEAACAQ